MRGPEIKVPAVPQLRKKVVLYTANNFPRILAGIKIEAMAYDEAYIMTSAAPIKNAPVKINCKCIVVAVIVKPIIPIEVPNINVLECPNFLLKKPAVNPIASVANDRIFAIQLSNTLLTLKPESKERY